MSDTRPQFSEEEFERLAAHREPNWWGTGEGLIYREEVTSLPGWRTYGSPDHLKLTEAQRCLMMWGDIVGQVQNGGIAQFFGNYESALEFAGACVSQLGWPELKDRYDKAFTDYIHVNGEDATLDQWRAHRASEHERYRREAKAKVEQASGKPFDGDMEKLDRWVWMFAARGDFAIQGWEHPCVDEFNAWFYSDATKDSSSRYILAFAQGRRDELARIA